MRGNRIAHWPLAAALALMGVAVPVCAQPVAPAPGEVAIPYQPAQAITLARKVADHQLRMLASGPAGSSLSSDSWNERGWIQGALFVGLRDLADREKDPRYRAAILTRGKANAWQLGKRTYHADDQVIGQAYLWAYRHGAGAASIAPLKARYDQILSDPPTGGLEHPERGASDVPDCRRRWCWADALFMAPPTWLELAKVTGDTRYADYAKTEFEATSDFLFDGTEGLYYRDSRFFDRRGPDGEKIFWSRGNGWVLAGLARMIPFLADRDPTRKRMESIFKAMSAKLITVQKPDGYWSPSLLADPSTTRPETSGTAFFTYGLAWGIKAGLLDRATYEPAVRKGWAALVRAVHPDGRIGFVQPVGDRPDNVSYFDTQFYGGGGFLLAATAVADLDLAPGADPTVATATPKPQMVLNVANQDSGGKRSYRLRQKFNVPPTHRIGDHLMAFEGLGWESDVAGYRLYLDERMAIDIFGKREPDNVLHRVGLGADDYHSLAPWGMDIFKVGDTVGVGAIGRLRGGKAVQLGPSTISVMIDSAAPARASAEVTNSKLDGADGVLVTRYTIEAGSALTRVSAKARSGDGAPFVTGLTKHDGATVVEAEADSTGWAYVATWGRQSLAGDDLGIALFYYRPDHVAGPPVDDGATLYLAFRDPSAIEYAFGSAWAQDQQGIHSLDEFKSWLSKRRYELASR